MEVKLTEKIMEGIMCCANSQDLCGECPYAKDEKCFDSLIKDIANAVLPSPSVTERCMKCLKVLPKGKQLCGQCSGKPI